MISRREIISLSLSSTSSSSSSSPPQQQQQHKQSKPSSQQPTIIDDDDARRNNCHLKLQQQPQRLSTEMKLAAKFTKHFSTSQQNSPQQQQQQQQHSTTTTSNNNNSKSHPKSRQGSAASSAFASSASSSPLSSTSAASSTSSSSSFNFAEQNSYNSLMHLSGGKQATQQHWSRKPPPHLGSRVPTTTTTSMTTNMTTATTNFSRVFTSNGANVDSASSANFDPYSVYGDDLDDDDDEVWFSDAKLIEDNLSEVRAKWRSIDDEIWAKIICMERNRRVAKAYARKTALKVNGSFDEYSDGSTLGLNAFENSTRDSKTAKVKRSIGKGVQLRITRSGDILVRRLTNCAVFALSSSDGDFSEFGAPNSRKCNIAAAAAANRRCTKAAAYSRRWPSSQRFNAADCHYRTADSLYSTSGATNDYCFAELNSRRLFNSSRNLSCESCACTNAAAAGAFHCKSLSSLDLTPTSTISTLDDDDDCHASHYNRRATAAAAVAAAATKFDCAELAFDLPFKLFDMAKFRESLVREARAQNPNRAKLQAQAVTVLSFATSASSNGNLLNLPVWLIVINIVAVDLIKSTLGFGVDECRHATAAAASHARLAGAPSAAAAVSRAELRLGLLAATRSSRLQRRSQALQSRLQSPSPYSAPPPTKPASAERRFSPPLEPSLKQLPFASVKFVDENGVCKLLRKAQSAIKAPSNGALEDGAFELVMSDAPPTIPAHARLAPPETQRNILRLLSRVAALNATADDDEACHAASPHNSELAAGSSAVSGCCQRRPLPVLPNTNNSAINCKQQPSARLQTSRFNGHKQQMKR